MYPTPFLPKIWGLKQIKLFCRESLKINPIPSFPLIQLHLRNRGFASIWQSAKKILIIWIGCLWYLFTEWSSLAHLSRSFFCSKSSLTSSARQTLKVQGRYHANQPTKGRAKGLVARISSLPIPKSVLNLGPLPLHILLNLLWQPPSQIAELRNYYSRFIPLSLHLHFPSIRLRLQCLTFGRNISNAMLSQFSVQWQLRNCINNSYYDFRSDLTLQSGHATTFHNISDQGFQKGGRGSQSKKRDSLENHQLSLRFSP